MIRTTSLLNRTFVVMGSCARAKTKIRRSEQKVAAANRKKRERVERKSAGRTEALKGGDANDDLLCSSVSQPPGAFAPPIFRLALSFVWLWFRRFVDGEADPADHHFFPCLVAPTNFLGGVRIELVLV